MKVQESLRPARRLEPRNNIASSDDRQPGNTKSILPLSALKPVYLLPLFSITNTLLSPCIVFEFSAGIVSHPDPATSGLSSTATVSFDRDGIGSPS